jgi:hypothetical protein
MPIAAPEAWPARLQRKLCGTLLKFMQRLAALVPRPRARSCGVEFQEDERIKKYESLEVRVEPSIFPELN